MENDKYIETVIQINYVYFIYSNITNKVYIGETQNISRIEIYKSIIEEEEEKKRFWLYNFYTKHNEINRKLSYDIVNKHNNFKIYYIRTKYNKHLEKSYIRFFIDNNIKLYNTFLYKNHKYNLQEIDTNILNIII